MNIFLKKLALCALLLPAINTMAQTGKPVEVQVTPYKTTIIANGKDEALLVIKIIDRKGNEVPVKKQVIYKLTGGATLISINGDKNVAALKTTDTTWVTTIDGSAKLILRAGKTLEHIRFAATADSLWEGTTDILTVQPGKPHKVTTAKYTPKTTTDKVLGADISFLPELEARGIKFSDNGVEKDAIAILKEHGINYIRLRIFNDPAQPKGYSPNMGFCDLEHTMQMAKRAKDAGLKVLLDFHYSDYWADPGKQFKPKAWEGQDFTTLKKSVYDFTVNTLQQLKAQGTTPDMVQVGNEINHGIVWPEGSIANLDSLASLLYEGVKGVHAVDPKMLVMLHVALGGQKQESDFFYEAMQARNVPYDIIGLSYYPKWHGTLADLTDNIAYLSKKYNRQIMVAEYTFLKKEVNDIAFNVPSGKGIGSFIWEPLNTWEMVFDKSGKSNELLDVYPEIAKKYLTK